MIVTNILKAYSKWYISLRNKYPNTYIVIISVLVTLWFQGMTRIIDKLFPNKSLKINMWLMVIPLLLMYFGDGRLEEIYNFENVKKRITAINTIKNMD